MRFCVVVIFDVTVADKAVAFYACAFGRVGGKFRVPRKRVGFGTVQLLVSEHGLANVNAAVVDDGGFKNVGAQKTHGTAYAFPDRVVA